MKTQKSQKTSGWAGVSNRFYQRGEMKYRCLTPFVIFVWIALAQLHAEDFAVIPLWPNGVPGFAERKEEPEQAKDYWVKNIHHPSLTVVLPPKGKANGTAVVICPGGGHRELVFNREGIEPAQYLANLGVTAFVLKYRLARQEGSPYKLEEHTFADIKRAMRMVRTRAGEWGINPDRIGIMGWSAGGEVAAMVSYRPVVGDPAAADPIDRADAKPNFEISIYPGGYATPETVPAGSPPAFFLCANDDLGPAKVISAMLEKYRAAGIPVEVHIYAEGHHAFNMGDRSDLVSIRAWPQRMAEWLEDRGLLRPAGMGGSASKK